MQKLLFYALTTGALLALAGAAAARDELDRRHRSEAEAYEIGFCARGDSPTGHAFVTLSKIDVKTGKRSYLAVGHAPEDKKAELLGKVPGGIREERYTSKTQDCFFVLVDSEVYRRVEVHVEASQHRDYFLFLNDCVVFMREVAQLLGITVADRVNGLTPQAYVRALRAANF